MKCEKSDGLSFDTAQNTCLVDTNGIQQGVAYCGQRKKSEGIGLPKSQCSV